MSTTPRGLQKGRPLRLDQQQLVLAKDALLVYNSGHGRGVGELHETFGISLSHMASASPEQCKDYYKKLAASTQVLEMVGGEFLAGCDGVGRFKETTKSAHLHDCYLFPARTHAGLTEFLKEGTPLHFAECLRLDSKVEAVAGELKLKLVEAGIKSTIKFSDVDPNHLRSALRNVVPAIFSPEYEGLIGRSKKSKKAKRPRFFAADEAKGYRNKHLSGRLVSNTLRELLESASTDVSIRPLILEHLQYEAADFFDPTKASAFDCVEAVIRGIREEDLAFCVENHYLPSVETILCVLKGLSLFDSFLEFIGSAEADLYESKVAEPAPEAEAGAEVEVEVLPPEAAKVLKIKVQGLDFYHKFLEHIAYSRTPVCEGGESKVGGKRWFEIDPDHIPDFGYALNELEKVASVGYRLMDMAFLVWQGQRTLAGRKGVHTKLLTYYDPKYHEDGGRTPERKSAPLSMLFAAAWATRYAYRDNVVDIGWCTIATRPAITGYPPSGVSCYALEELAEGKAKLERIERERAATSGSVQDAKAKAVQDGVHGVGQLTGAGMRLNELTLMLRVRGAKREDLLLQIKQLTDLASSLAALPELRAQCQVKIGELTMQVLGMTGAPAPAPHAVSDATMWGEKAKAYQRSGRNESSRGAPGSAIQVD